jgi:hypothetical protein
MRVERQLTIDELAARLALSRSTVYYWVRDLPLTRPPRTNPGQRRGNRRMVAKYRLLREAAYQEGLEMFPRLSRLPTFREFVTLYIAEGSKRCRNRVSLANSDPAVVKFANAWICRFARNPVTYWLQFHADQNLNELARFWAVGLAVGPEAIRLQRKSNSGQLRGRTWRSEHGVLTVSVSDTYFRARLQAWIDCLHREWLDSLPIGA